MRTFRKVKDDDFIKYEDIFNYADMLFGFEKQESFIMRDENNESIIFYCPPIFMKFWFDDKKRIKTSSFYVSEENKIEAFTKDDYQINENDNGMVFIHEDGNIYYLSLLDNQEDVDFEVANNGVVMFSQYNRKQDIRVITKFEHNVWNNRREIYDYHLKEPFSITIESKASKRDKGLKFLGYKNSYYKLDFDVRQNRWQYDLATLKDFGIGAVLAKDTYSLQQQESFSKYYRVLLSVSDYITITGFPFTRQYNTEDIFKLIKSLGFDIEIPELFIRIYNNREYYNNENQQILDWYLSNIALEPKKFSKAI